MMKKVLQRLRKVKKKSEDTQKKTGKTTGIEKFDKKQEVINKILAEV